MKKAIILGATGLVGSHLLPLLIEDKEYKEVTLILRRKIEMTHPKLNQIVLEDFHQMESYRDLFFVNDVFCCLGTTRKNAKSQEKFKEVDFHFPLRAAKLSKEGGVHRFLLISALGADPNSRFFYNQVKGELEQAIQLEKLPSFMIFRPSLLVGKRDEFRFGEKLATYVSKPLSIFLKGPFQKYAPIEASQVAFVMHRMAQTYFSGTHIYENDQMHLLANSNK